MWFAISLKCILWSFWPLTSRFACVTQGCFCAHGRHDTQSSQGFLALINRWQWCMEHWHVPERQRRKRALASEPRNLKRRKGTSSDEEVPPKNERTPSREWWFLFYFINMLFNQWLCVGEALAVSSMKISTTCPIRQSPSFRGVFFHFLESFPYHKSYNVKYVCFWCVSPWISHWLQHNRHPSPASNQDSVTYSNDLS